MMASISQPDLFVDNVVAQNEPISEVHQAVPKGYDDTGARVYFYEEYESLVRLIHELTRDLIKPFRGSS